MLDWKILASALIALLVVSFILLEGFGSFSIFSGTVNSIGEWFGSSPFGGLVPAGDAGSKHVTIMLYPSNLTLEPDGEIGIQTGTMNITGFVGTIQADFVDGILVLNEKGSDLKVAIPLKNVRMDGFALEMLVLEEAGFMIEPNMTADNGTIEIENFVGMVTAKHNGLELDGNISKLTAKIGELEWEMS